MDKVEVTKQINPEMEQTAEQRARDRTNTAKWDLSIVIYLFTFLILVMLLVAYTEIVMEIVATIAIFGLSIA